MPNRISFADHIIEIPSIILYLEEQINDIRNLYCTGQMVFGFDKLFNLCDMHICVTMSWYKQLAISKDKTGKPLLFFGPMYIHDISNFESFSTFFSQLKTKLSSVDTSRLVIGSDNEKALVYAISFSFQDSKHILCTRHLRQNVKPETNGCCCW